MKKLVFAMFFAFFCDYVSAQQCTGMYRGGGGGSTHLSPEDFKIKVKSFQDQGGNLLDVWKTLDKEATDTSVMGIAVEMVGPPQACAALAAEHGSNDPFHTVSWWCGSASKSAPTTIHFKIRPDGHAVMYLIQNGIVIGQGRARTNSDVSLQPKAGTYSAHKDPEADATRKVGRPARKSYAASGKHGFDVMMVYPINIYGGFFAHGGNNSGQSGGCMRVNELSEVEYGFNITKIIIQHLEN